MKYKRVLSDRQNLMVWLLCAVLLLLVPATAFSFAFADSTGNTVNIDKPPARVVSLVPSITEIIFEIGAGDAVRAVIQRIKKEFVTAMFLLGAQRIEDLKGHQELIQG